jgi:hypothetical protein
MSGIAVAGRNDEARRFMFCFAYSLLLRRLAL